MAVSNWSQQKCSRCGDVMGLVPYEINVVVYCDDCDPLPQKETKTATVPDRYNSKFDSVREDVIERDNHTCQQCGIHESDATFLDCHHIDGDQNTLENLVMLCRMCHSRIESDKVEPKYNM